MGFYCLQNEHYFNKTRSLSVTLHVRAWGRTESNDAYWLMNIFQGGLNIDAFTSVSKRERGFKLATLEYRGKIC